MTNMGENNAASIEAELVQYQVIFHQDEPAPPPEVPTYDAGGTTPPAGASDAPEDQVPTEITTP